MQRASWAQLVTITSAVLSVCTGTGVGQWTQTSGPEGGIIHALVIDNGDLFAGTSFGVYASGDGGLHWRSLSTDLTNPRVQSLVASGGILFAGTQGGGVCRSTDRGQSWRAANSGLTDPYVQAMVLSNGVLIAGTQAGGVYVSMNSGSTWEQRSNGLVIGDVRCVVPAGNCWLAGTSGGGVYR